MIKHAVVLASVFALGCGGETVYECEPGNELEGSIWAVTDESPSFGCAGVITFPDVDFASTEDVTCDDVVTANFTTRGEEVVNGPFEFVGVMTDADTLEGHFVEFRCNPGGAPVTLTRYRR